MCAPSWNTIASWNTMCHRHWRSVTCVGCTRAGETSGRRAVIRGPHAGQYLQHPTVRHGLGNYLQGYRQRAVHCNVVNGHPPHLPSVLQPHPRVQPRLPRPQPHQVLRKAQRPSARMPPLQIADSSLDDGAMGGAVLALMALLPGLRHPLPSWSYSSSNQGTVTQQALDTCSP